MESLGFLLKKTLTAFILPPGIFLVLLIMAILFIRKRLRTVLLGFALILYLVSIEPVKNFIVLPLENAYPVPSWSELQRADAIVVLGGGLLDNAPDIDGPGALTADSLARVLGAYRIHATLKKPIIVAGGAGPGRIPESELSKKVLLRLGVKEQLLLTETRSMDTSENASFAWDICKKRNWKRIALVTSAYHMKRATMLFGKFFSDVVPFPTDYKSARRGYDYWSFLPDASNMADTGAALKEYLGIIYYKLTLRSSG
jgi:uncharacterized SAM-binding protein YcdF (DUF218 family)